MSTVTQAVRAALDVDAAGRPFEQLLREAALLIDHCGGGPLGDCLRTKADQVRAAQAALADEARS